MMFWKHKFLCFSGACVCGSNIAYTSDKQITEYFHHLLKNRRKLFSNDGLRHTIVHVGFLYHPVSLNVNPTLRDVLCRESNRRLPGKPRIYQASQQKAERTGEPVRSGIERRD